MRQNHTVTLASVPHQLKALVRRLRRQGVVVEIRPNGHMNLVWPSGAVVRCSASPSDQNVVHQVRRTISRRGLPLGA